MSIADRSLLACWGVRGGRAGRPFSVVIDPGGPNERAVDALADAEPVRAGEVIRIRTTGGGGWGDPLERPYDEVLRATSRWGKVSVEGAWADYGVRVRGRARWTRPAVRTRERAARRAQRGPRVEPFFDRGPGYAGRCSRRPRPSPRWTSYEPRVRDRAGRQRDDRRRTAGPGPDDQIAAIARAAEPIADVVAGGPRWC